MLDASPIPASQTSALPDGLLSNISEPPRCISFSKPNVETWLGRSAVTLVEDKDVDKVKIEYPVGTHREQGPKSEQNEERCNRLDVCGVAKHSVDGGFINLDL